jgi:tRNA (mo5U34)-methyltransferase
MSVMEFYMSLSEEVAKYHWFHTIDLGHGVVTPGSKSAAHMDQEASALFDCLDLTDKTLLDIGAWNGGFSVLAKRRGARSVTGLDHFTWNHPTLRGRETFDLVSKATKYDFEAIDVDLDNQSLSLEFVGTFDVVLFAGVFYHLFDPIAATREVAALAKECLIVETHVEVIENDRRPAMILYPGAELSNDPTNWWGPNIPCMVALLKLYGFPRVTVRNGSAVQRKVFHAYRSLDATASLMG